MSALTASSFTEAPEIEYDRPVLYVVEAPARVRKVRRAPKARPARPAPRAVRLTRRGRSVITLTFLAIALGLMVAFGGWATATLTGGTPDPVQVVEVQPGQNLYDIAGQVAKPGHVREMVYKIEEMNSLPSATISEGQKLAIPQG
jgi:hypothetical protein